MKVHHSLATYHGGAADMNKRCAMWLPTFLQRGIHFFGERTEVLAFNNFVLFDRVHLPIIGKRAAVVEEKAALLSQSAVTLRRVALSALLTNYQSSIPLIRHDRTCSSVDFGQIAVAPSDLEYNQGRDH